jgi:hypothetical protein
MALGNEARLVLSFELVDKATAQATANLQKIKNEAKTTNSEMQKGFANTEQSLKSVERGLTSVSRSAAVLGAAIIGPLAIAVNTASKSNYELFHAQNMIKDSMEDLFKSIGGSMVPVMNDLARKIQEAVTWWTSMDKAQRDNIIQTAAWAAGVLVAVAAALKLVAAALKLVEVFEKFSVFLKPGGAILGGLTALVTVSASLVDWWAKLNGHFLTAFQRWERIKQFAAFAVNPVGGLVNLAMRKGADIGNRAFGGKGTEEDPINLGSISVGGGKAKAQEKQLDQLKNKAVSVADEIGNRFAIMAETYMRSLGGVAGVTMTVIQTSIDGVTKGLGDSVAQAIVYGKDFAESMKAALQSLAAQIISFLVSTIAKIVVLRALGVVGPISTGAIGMGGGSVGSGGDGGGGSSKGGGIGGFFKNIFGFANGGTISEPVVGVGMRSGAGYTIAERGPEQVVPFGGRASSGGGSMSITINNPQVRSQRDIDEIVYQVSKAFKREAMRA